MKPIAKYFIAVIAILCLFPKVWETGASIYKNPSPISHLLSPIFSDSIPEDSAGTDTVISLPYPFDDNVEVQQSGSTDNGLYLNDPSNIQTTTEYDPETGQYEITQTIGDHNFRNPAYMTFDEYLDYDMDRAIKNYWQQKATSESFDRQRAIIPKIHIGSEVVDRIFGGSTVDIRPQGSAELTFAIKVSKNDDPSLPEKTRKVSTFDFDEKIQMSVTGSIGDKLKLTTRYNTEATFDFENKMKLEYAGKEDEIIKKIEAGDVSLPLTGSLITGSQTLFGIKTQLQFGKLFVTSVFSQEKGKKSEIDVKGGAQTVEFDVQADHYEENKHFFLAQYFRDNYEKALEKLPLINSGVNITKIEVWVSSRLGQTDNVRNIVAFMDLGESDYFDNTGFISSYNETVPSNGTNTLYETITDSVNVYYVIRDINKVNSIFNANSQLTAAQDYEKVESARLLSSSEYTLNNQLGFISLRSALSNDDVLAVAFQYTLNGKTYQVGEFSSLSGISAPNALFVKLLKSTEIKTNLPTWDLMMKNVYAVGSYNVQQEGFKLDILYKDPEIGTPANYLKEGAMKSIPLIRVLNLDNLDSKLGPYPDGLFDFINGVTINKSNGRVYFPVLEPFGEYLKNKITGGDYNLLTLANKYIFEELYEMTKSDAQQEFPDKNRFSLVGSYQSASGSEISLNAMNVPEGSITVSAGGRQLAENIDYTVNYAMGRVTIINEGILNSGTPIKIAFESNTLFNIQSKTLMGSRFDYRMSKDLNLGGTIMHLTERPITQKINIGDEPISNTIWGLDADYRTESPFITRMVNKIPLLNTAATSSITVNGEIANMIPGHSRAVGKEGISYIDDFEGSRSSIDLKSFSTWVLASTPQGQPDLFPEAEPSTGLEYGYNRAKFAWHVIDPLFARNNNLTPDHIKDSPEQSNHYVREIYETEIFPKKQLPSGYVPNMAVFDLAFYPDKRGSYNYDVNNVNTDGTFSNPGERWGGIMRAITTNDFEAANIEFIEFWMMDPFHGDNGNNNQTGGDLYFNLGSISEDILRDGRKSYENGLPTSADLTPADTTIWGRVSATQAIVDAFDSDPEARKMQDVGLDGLGDEDEKTFFNSYLNSMLQYGIESTAYKEANEDPSSDNYHYFRGEDYDNEEKSILGRYELYNGLEGNSPTTESSPEDYPTSSTTLPNKEDINRDNTLDENESYYQYRVSLRPEDMIKGQNYITDVVTGTGTTKDDNPIDVKWYQFKIPIKNPDKVIGDKQDFKSIRFLRVFLKGFEEKAICRFARLALVRSEWRKSNFDLKADGDYLQDDDFDATAFDVSVVNIEENSNYVIPPDIERELDIGDPNLRELNEQSLLLKVCGLEDGDARAAYKIADFDVRAYKKLKMFVHAEAVSDALLKYGDLTVFMRFGSDFTDNYYEYEIPLTFTLSGSTTDPSVIWPEANHFDFEFAVLHDVKQERNKENWDNRLRYPQNGYPDGINRVYVKGNPDLSRVKTIMIGIRNPKRDDQHLNDDGLPKCAEIWVNELRLTDFDEKSGWAANSRVSTRLADFGIINLAGGFRTPGFGSIEKKVNERDRETTLQYDISSTLQLGNFIPDKVGIKIPMYVGYSEQIKKPQYNPLDPDILMEDALEEYDPAEQDSIKNISRDYTRRKSINFTNVKKTKGKSSKKPHIYDIENLALTYAFTEDHSSNINTEFNTARTYRGALSYNFNANPKNIKPFAKMKAFRKAKYLRLLKDFNFYYMPSRLSFRTDLDRKYSEAKPRNTTNYDLIIDTTFAKMFTWNRIYDLKYDITSSLKMDFSARNIASIDEPQGRIDKEWEKDSIWENIYSFGRTTNYNHTANANYMLPLSKIPLTNWITASVRYGATYDWIGAPQGLDSLGHTIKNSNTKQLNGQLNMVNFYNKVKYLKKINQKYGKSGKGKPKPEPSYKKVKYEMDDVSFKARKPKKITHDLETKDINVEVFDSKGEEVKGKIFIINENKVTFEIKKDVKNAKVIVTGKIKRRKVNIIKIAELTARTAMSVKNVSFTYSENNGTTLPGYMKKTEIIGQDWDASAPGMDFLFGYQPDTVWLHEKSREGWISPSTSLYTSYQQTGTKNLDIKAKVEPLPGLRIDLTANRNESRNYSEVFKDSIGDGEHFEHLSPMEGGNYSISFFSLPTAFTRDDDDHVSKTFTEFANNREGVATLLAEEYEKRNIMNGSTPEADYAQRFGGTSQDVLIPAFMEAYGGVNPSNVLFNPFLKIPKPNWRITYDGLSKIPLIEKHCKTVTIGHAYRSTFSISSFTTNLYYIDESRTMELDKEYTTEKDVNGNYYSKYEINQISISEQLSPLIKVDVTWKNSLLTRFEIKKTKNLSMDFSNNQLTEVRGTEIVVGAGYRFKDVEIPIEIGRTKKRLKSDVNLKADFSLRDNETIIRKLVEGTNTTSKGLRTIIIDIKADYVINQRFNLRLFYKKNINVPFVSNLHKTSTMSAGLTIRFTLAP
ncbi:MAG: cell surface protein SprA [Bacteroidota bacterium]